MTDAAPVPLDMLDAWPWPRWEFVAATSSDDGVTVALAPIDARRDIAGRTVDGTGAEVTFDG